MGRIPWKKICSLLEALEAERSIPSFLERGMEQVRLLIPSDHALAIHMRERRFQTPSTFIPGTPPSGFWEKYLAHYRTVDPHYRQVVFDHLPTVAYEDVRRDMKTEFVNDFLLPNRVCHLLLMSDVGVAPANEFFLCLYRDRWTRFTDLEISMAEILYPHTHALFQAVSERKPTIDAAVEQAAARGGLSRREAQIAVLVVQGLATREIADQLFISHKTVSKHLEHLYEKLGARRRSDVRRMLTGKPRPYGPDSLWSASRD